MNRTVWFLFIFIFFSCCQHAPSVHFSFWDVTYSNGWGINYSIKIDSTGYALLGRGTKANTVFKGQLDEKQLRKMDSLYDIISRANYVNSYIDSTGEDMISYKLIFAGKKDKEIYVYGSLVPVEIVTLINYVNALEQQVKFTPIDTIVNFKSINGFYPPSPSQVD